MPATIMFLPYLQSWDGAALTMRLLAAPQNSPLDSLSAGEPAFVDADFQFEVRLVQGLAGLPTTASAFTAVNMAGAHPPQARDICQALLAALAIDTTIGPVNPRLAGGRFLKYAPPPYRNATGYSEGGSPYVITSDRYHCALKSPPPAGTALKADPPKLSWGKVLASALRQPLLSRSIGLVREFNVATPPDFFLHGGWVYVSLAAGSAGASLLTIPDAVKLYAARVPPLGAARSLFTSVLFPVGPLPPPGDYDTLFQEVVDYDDGFAKVVYANQPARLELLKEEDDGTRPAQDWGVQLGWDDEQIATWLNRQVAPPGGLDAPMGIFGYRIDARESGAVDWNSLVLGDTAVTVNGLALGNWSGEFQVEIAPHKLMGDTSGDYWIPSYYTAWHGPSLVGPDPTAAALKGIVPSTVVVGRTPAIDLLYGYSYEFRVRLVDHTGGGPAPDAAPVNPAPQPLAPLRFLRWVRPGALRNDVLIPAVPDPANAPGTLRVRRPRLGYPEYGFARGAVADLLADLPLASAQNRAVGLPDPDVDDVTVTVEVAFPGETTGYRQLYQTIRAFPPGPDDVLEIPITWQDMPSVLGLAAPAAGAIVLPTARQVRVSLSALCSQKADYYGADDVRNGPASNYLLRKESRDETGLLLETSNAAILGSYLQPDVPVLPAIATAQQAGGQGLAALDNPIGRLAAALDLEAVDLGLRARAGRRLLLGVSPTIRSVIGPDGASIKFSALGDITQHWIIALRMDMERDWSWDGLQYLSIQRGGVEVGRIQPRSSVAPEALSPAQADRSHLVFLDAIDPKPAPGHWPAELDVNYVVTPVFVAAPGASDPALNFALHLPITTAPAQVPKLVSAGIALSPYQRDDKYSHTELRDRTLWFEFDSPIQNPADLYFARVLALAPDSALFNARDFPDAPEPPLAIDPEAIRVISPGQSDDEAGLNAMQPLTPTDSPLHYWVSLPAGLTSESPELFGFFTYELRVGHAEGWTTAQGRFGRPLRVTGVQHPSPPLKCSVVRSSRGVEVSANFADAIVSGNSLRPFPAVSQIWILLYAQAHQADDADRRNILLGTRQARPIVQRWETKAQRLRADSGTVMWSQDELMTLLSGVLLDPHTPLSCLAVETLPGTSPNPDPVASGLGYERFLRTSPLTAVPAQC